MTLCRFGLTHAIDPQGVHVVRAYCGCGWVGIEHHYIEIPPRLPSQYEWERHRSTFAAEVRKRRVFV